MDWFWVWLIIVGAILYLLIKDKKARKRVSSSARLWRNRFISLKGFC